MSQKTVGFVSFAGGHLRWKLTKFRIMRQVKASKYFHCIEMFSEKSLDEIIGTDIAEFISANRVGYGLWIWKPIIILDFLNKNPKCDAVLYLDAGCDFNGTDLSLRKWKEYLSYMDEYNAVAFQTSYVEKSYSSKRLVKRLMNENSDVETGQFHAAAFLMQRKFALEFCTKWLNYMTEEDFKLLKNENVKDVNSFYDSYVDYRYDQSIFSLMIKRQNKVKTLQADEELDFAPDWKRGTSFPILTSRNRSIVPVLKTGLVFRVLRKLERKVIKTYNQFNDYKLTRNSR